MNRAIFFSDNWFCRNPEFLTNGIAPVYGWDIACPPKPPFRSAIVLYCFLWSYRFRGCHSGGGGGMTCSRPKKGVNKNRGFLYEIELNRCA